MKILYHDNATHYHEFHNNGVAKDLSRHGTELCNARINMLISCHILSLLPSTQPSMYVSVKYYTSGIRNFLKV